MPTADDFRRQLQAMFSSAEQQGLNAVDIHAEQLHRHVGDYPNPAKHRMPICCQIMRNEMRPGDVLLSEPPFGTSVERFDLKLIHSSSDSHVSMCLGCEVSFLTPAGTRTQSRQS